MKTALKTLLAVGAVASVASATVVFDYSVGNTGDGTMVLDDSHYQLASSAVTLLQHADGNFYPAAQGWTEGCGWDCPNGPLVEEPEGSGNWVSPCYWGWNDADMVTENSVKVGVKLMEFVNPGGWGGYTNGGFFYIHGTNWENSTPWPTVSSIWAVFKGVAGMPVKLYSKDKDPYGATEGMPNVETVANGQWQKIGGAASSFLPYADATNTFDPSHLIGVGLEYVLYPTVSDGPCTLCSDQVKDLEWMKLCFDEECTLPGGGAIGDKVASQSVGFAALRNGLQFSNVGSATLNVQVFNTLGKVVASHKVTAKNSFVSTEGLGNGVYVVRATDGAKLNMMRNVTIMR